MLGTKYRGTRLLKAVDNINEEIKEKYGVRNDKKSGDTCSRIGDKIFACNESTAKGNAAGC
jgi:hypothetical protein